MGAINIKGVQARDDHFLGSCALEATIVIGPAVNGYLHPFESNILQRDDTIFLPRPA